MVIIPPFLAMEIQAVHGAQRSACCQSQPSQATQNSTGTLVELRFFIFNFLEILDKSGYWQQKDHFYLFNGPKIAQKIWILVKKRALKFILHAHISKYFRQTKLPARGILNISASPFFTVLTSLCSIQKRKLA